MRHPPYIILSASCFTMIRRAALPEGACKPLATRPAQYSGPMLSLQLSDGLRRRLEKLVRQLDGVAPGRQRWRTAMFRTAAGGFDLALIPQPWRPAPGAPTLPRLSCNPGVRHGRSRQYREGIEFLDIP